MTLCACGCGEELDFTKGRKDKKYIPGHHQRTKVVKQKIRDTLLGNIPWNKGLTKDTDERVRKQSETQTGQVYTEERCSNISLSLMGRNSWNKGLTKDADERVRKYGEKLKNRIFSDDTKKKMSDSAKNRPPITENSRRKMSESRLGEKNHFFGKKHSEKTKQKIRDNHADISGENHPCWMGGISFEPYGQEFKPLRNKIRKRDNHTCQLCGEQNNNDVELSIHHIDYDKKNNNPNNLISLCIACHTKTSFNREYWTKYFNDYQNRR